jgi:hypothetical protein
LFVATVVGAWAWFNAAPPPGPDLIWLEVLTNFPGHKFVPEPLSKNVVEILGSPEFLNGTFVPSAETAGSEDIARTIRIFRANWAGKSDYGMSVLQHTPDICWVGAGWESIDLGQPSQIDIKIRRRTSRGEVSQTAPQEVAIPFECRTFLSPNGQSRELVVWCTLVGGQVMPESSVFRLEEKVSASSEKKQERLSSTGRRLSAGYFMNALRERLRTRGTKQFVRISTPLDLNTPQVLKDLGAISSKLLSADSYYDAQRSPRKVSERDFSNNAH